MLVKTSELTGPALDWAVASAAGYTISDLDLLYDIKSYDKYKPSTDWEHGGPIIERETLFLEPDDLNYAGKCYRWRCCNFFTNGEGPLADEVGPSPLIAAMRCYVSIKLGDEVNIPDELLDKS